MQKVFYSPGPYANTATYELIDFDGEPSVEDLADVGLGMAIDHYESYMDPQEYEEEYGMEIEYDYGWYDIDDPEVQGQF